MNATLPTTSDLSRDERSTLHAETMERFLTGQGFILSEDGETFPVRVLDSNRAGTRSLIAQCTASGDSILTRWVDDELIELAGS